MKVGYVKISSAAPDAGRQLSLLQEQKVGRVFIDMKTGNNTDDDVFGEMIDTVREGDIIVVESFSRLAENVKDFLSIAAMLEEKGLGLISLKENIDTTAPECGAVLFAFSALAGLEREVFLAHQHAGIEKARKAGKYKGRKPVQFDESRLSEVCGRWRAGEITAVAAMKELNLKPNTFYRRVKERGL